LITSCIAGCPAVLAVAQSSPCASIKTDDLIACAASELKSEEAKLASIVARYRAMLAQEDRRTREIYSSGLPPGLELRGTLLQDREQAAWHQYRDASCERRTYENLGGRERPIYVLDCKAQLTRERSRDLLRDLEPAQGESK
jgi:uncharacterized protein YecT (DUF1311 family)